MLGGLLINMVKTKRNVSEKVLKELFIQGYNDASTDSNLNIIFDPTSGYINLQENNIEIDTPKLD